MKKTLSLSLFASALCLLVPAQAQVLFNGKDLSGWDGDPALWRVEDGVIVGETTPEKKAAQNTFLIWKGGDVTDFRFTMTARVIGKNNSGIQYRSKVRDAKKWSVGGYQMDMHPSPKFFGMLYEERGRGIVAKRGQRIMVDEKGKKHEVGTVDKSAKLDISQWNTYTIEVRDNKAVHMVNGKVTSEIIDKQTDKAAKSGVIALQLHAGPPMRLEAKDIKLFKLTPGAPAAPVKVGRSIAKLKPPKTPEWIWTTKPAKSGTIYARRQFTLDEDVTSAMLTATCDNGFIAFVNGQKVGNGSAWEKRYEFEVGKHLRKGDNVLAFEATNEGSVGGLVARLIVVDKKKRRKFISTDGEWLVSEKKGDDWMTPSIDTAGWKNAVTVGKMGDGPWGNVFSKTAAKKAPPAAPSSSAKVHPQGFEVEKLYDVPKGEQGSWVSMAVDDKGRLYCGDQGKQGIFRVTLGSPIKVEKVPVDITGAQGMCWAFGGLYVSLNGGKPGSGLYKLTDSNGDDQLDKMVTLRKFEGGGEHGPHAVIPSPDGKSLFVIGGNHTKPPKPDTSAVLPNYAEDQLLPRMPDARGHASKIRAPGGWVARTDPEGKSFELYSAGFRNQYDIAFNPDGEMFTFDSDMEWDSGTPWYRPTRIYHVTRGSEFGWRTGTGKWPAYYPDVLPPALDVGPGSPTGVISGMGAKFPSKYQDAIYAFDWTYGTMYAIHLTPKGGSYEAVKEEFVTGVPLNISDGVIGKDGNMYFAVGGRGTTSALYRVKYTGDEPTDWKPVASKLGAYTRGLRMQMEAFHAKQDPAAVAKVWPNLGHEDRHVRYAARVALEHQPVAQWSQRALSEENTQAALGALLALARQGDEGMQIPLLEALAKLSPTEMTEPQKLEAMRVLGLCFIRMGKPDEQTAAEVATALTSLYPAKTDALNRELVALLVYLGADDVLAKTIPLLSQEAVSSEGLDVSDELLARQARYAKAFQATKDTNPQRQQIWYAYALKNVSEGWTPGLRKQFFEWFARAKNFKGGASFDGFIEKFRQEALAKISDETERKAMDELSKAAAPLVPEGFADARRIEVGVLRGMKFDKTELAAKAGEKVAIVLRNNDPDGLMHNLAVIAPGSRQKVIGAALTIGPKAIEQNFVPDIPEVLGATPQVAPGRQYTLYMTAPSEPGDYPYVCTYPGHGQLMFGTLKVAR